METLNKNKEEIEKLYNEMKECEKNWKTPQDNMKWTKRNADWFMSRWCYFERIKTSILWCEDEILSLEYLSRQMISANNMKATRTEVEIILQQLQTHLIYLKEQEKKI